MIVTAPAQGARIATTTGFAISLGPNESYELHVSLKDLAIQAGCTVTEGEVAVPEPVQEPEPVQSMVDADTIPSAEVERKMLIRAAITKMIDDGNKKDFFKRSGLPRPISVNALSGLTDVSEQEAAEVFNELTNVDRE